MKSPALPTRRVHTGDRLLDEIQRSTRDLTRKFSDMPFAYSVLLHAEDGQPDHSGLSFTAGTARSIVHGLGRAAVGFVEVYGADLVSTNHVGLRTSAPPSGVSSDTHVTVTPAATGKCFLVVF